jgi:hypothetical protein
MALGHEVLDDPVMTLVALLENVLRSALGDILGQSIGEALGESTILTLGVIVGNRLEDSSFVINVGKNVEASGLELTESTKEGDSE